MDIHREVYAEFGIRPFQLGFQFLCDQDGELTQAALRIFGRVTGQMREDTFNAVEIAPPCDVCNDRVFLSGACHHGGDTPLARAIFLRKDAKIHRTVGPTGQFQSLLDQIVLPCDSRFKKLHELTGVFKFFAHIAAYGSVLTGDMMRMTRKTDDSSAQAAVGRFEVDGAVCL